MDFPPELITFCRQADRIGVLTGAGISAESGIPTFREAQTGLWAQYQAEELATPQAFRRNPRLVWEWYAWRRQLVAEAEPNAGHRALAAWGRRVSSLRLITQNVDGLHQRAGSQDVIELHGNIQRYKCFNEGVVVDSWPATAEVPPLCPHCGAHLRPDVVWFGESLPTAALNEAFQIAERSQLLLVVGTSGLVQPAASLPLMAAEKGVTTVEINPQPTQLTRWLDYSLRGPAGEVLPALLTAVFPQ